MSISSQTDIEDDQSSTNSSSQNSQDDVQKSTLGNKKHNKNGSQAIEVFMRIRPAPVYTKALGVDTLTNSVAINTPKDISQGIVNNQREHHNFTFSGILTHEAKQDEVFQRVAVPGLNRAFEGYNCTIFACGQTGSGKTFTMTGSPERYIDRGIIPRTLSFIYKEIKNRPQLQFQVQISYLEIYNEICYDLLDPNREIQNMEDLPKVHVTESEAGEVVFKGLAIHRAANEEDALNLLFIGDTNRTISETPVNMASSRSHAVFTIILESRQPGADTFRRSKINLVDLAGSERIKKTGVEGVIQQEAKYINCSLHFLEQVIIALQERSMGIPRTHIPYRNSSMTMALKDSLGGNCKTVMVANVSPDPRWIDETISTLRFAQRVAMVANEIHINEEVDPRLLIKRLKEQIRDLREEIRLLKGDEEDRGDLTEGEIQQIRYKVQAYIANNQENRRLEINPQMLFIRAAYEAFRDIIVQNKLPVISPTQESNTKQGDQLTISSNNLLNSQQNNTLKQKQSIAPQPAPSPLFQQQNNVDQNEVKKLRLQLQQRDNEINILVSMLRKKEQHRGLELIGNSSVAASQANNQTDQRHVDGASSSQTTAPLSQNTKQADASILRDRSKAFEVFRKSYRKNDIIQENKAALQQKYTQAKSLGQQIQEQKQNIESIKKQIYQNRLRTVASEVAGQDTAQQERIKEQEAILKQNIEKEQTNYKQKYDQLRQLKSEIEQIHLFLEHSRVRLQKDFERWFQIMLQNQGEGSSTTANSIVPSPLAQHTSQTGASQPPSAKSSRKQAWADDQTTTVERQKNVSAYAAKILSQSRNWQENNRSQGIFPDQGSITGSKGAWTAQQILAQSAQASPIQMKAQPHHGQTQYNMSKNSPSIQQSSQSPQIQNVAGMNLANKFGLPQLQLQAAQKQSEYRQLTQKFKSDQPIDVQQIYKLLEIQNMNNEVAQLAKQALTGHIEADREVIKFYHAKQQLMMQQ